MTPFSKNLRNPNEFHTRPSLSISLCPNSGQTVIVKVNYLERRTDIEMNIIEEFEKPENTPLFSGSLCPKQSTQLLVLKLSKQPTVKQCQ